jgi:hypothetical protein
MQINNTPAPKLKVNLHEKDEVVAAYQAAAPQTPEQAEATLSGIKATGRLLGKCYHDEVEYVRPVLLAAVTRFGSASSTLQLA